MIARKPEGLWIRVIIFFLGKKVIVILFMKGVQIKKRTSLISEKELYLLDAIL